MDSEAFRLRVSEALKKCAVVHVLERVAWGFDDAGDVLVHASETALAERVGTLRGGHAWQVERLGAPGIQRVSLPHGTIAKYLNDPVVRRWSRGTAT